MKKILLLSMAFLAVLLFGCSRKKKEGPLPEWLETHYPGRCMIVETVSEDPIRNLSFKVKKSVIADKKDPDLQISLQWDARQQDLGISKQETDEAWEYAAKTLQDARSLHKALRASGLERFAVGVYHGDAAVLLFAEPTREQRQNTLTLLQKALAQWPAGKLYGLSVYFMEDSTYRQSFREIVPLQYWVFSSSTHRKNMLVYVHLEHPYILDPAKLSEQWHFDTESDRLLEYIDQSRPVAQVWAEKHLKQPVRLLPNMEYEALDDPMVIRFQYAYSLHTATEAEVTPDGYVAGDFDTDEKVFKNIRFTAQ